MTLLDLLKAPSAFRNDPWGFLRNQIGHAYLVGGGLALLGLPLWLIAAGYALWEWVQYSRYGADIDDCLEDLGHVMLIACAVHFSLPELILVHALFLGAGFFWRKGW